MRTEEGHPIQNKKKNKRREWLPTPVFLPGEFHGQKSLAGCSPWGHKESDMTEQLTHTHTHTHTHTQELLRVNGLRKEREKGKTAGGNGSLQHGKGSEV